jgi:hypothetical protein
MCVSVYACAKIGLDLFIYFLNRYSGEWSPSWVHSARRPLNGLLYLLRMIRMMENLVEWRLAGETEVLGKKLASMPLCPPQIPFDQTRIWTRGHRRGKPATNRLSYGAAFGFILLNRYTNVNKVEKKIQRNAIIKSP